MIRKDIQKFLANIPKNITIVAATKYVEVSEMVYLLNNGINNFGENRVEDFLRKYEALKDRSIIWHFIGHLQRNKAHKIINKIDYLHSLDSLKLAEEIDKRRETPLPCFVEVSVNHEESKNGVLYDETLDFIKSLQQFSKIKVVGLMMMGIQGSDVISLEQQLHISLPYLSMGMSEDYQTALKKGATHIRLGRILFDKM